MKQHRAEQPELPAPDWLAAYFDDELDEGGRARVEAWIADHPEAHAEMAAMSRLARVMESTTPPIPGEEQWGDTFHRIEAGLNAPVNSSSAAAACLSGSDRGQHLRLMFAGVGSLAAAVIVALLLSTWAFLETSNRTAPISSSSPTPAPEPEHAIEPYPVVLARDFTVQSIEPDPEDMVPVVPMIDGPNRPMILAPPEAGLDPEARKE